MCGPGSICAWDRCLEGASAPSSLISVDIPVSAALALPDALRPLAVQADMRVAQRRAHLDTPAGQGRIDWKLLQSSLCQLEQRLGTISKYRFKMFNSVEIYSCQIHNSIIVQTRVTGTAAPNPVGTAPLAHSVIKIWVARSLCRPHL